MLTLLSCGFIIVFALAASWLTDRYVINPAAIPQATLILIRNIVRVLMVEIVVIAIFVKLTSLV